MERQDPTRDYQRYIVMAINAERAAQGLTIKAMAERAGIVERTMLRVLKLERDLDFAQVDAIARALGVSVSSLVVEAERRRATSPERHGPTEAELVALIRNPSQDEWLVNHLSELESQSGVTGNKLRALLDHARTVRAHQLTAALDVIRGSDTSTG